MASPKPTRLSLFRSLTTAALAEREAIASRSRQGTVTNDDVADNVRPSLTLTSGTADPTNGTIAVTAQFSETVTGFVVGDISVTNGTAGSFVAVDGDTYTFVVTPTANGLVSISVAANVAQDAATNLNTASNTLTRTFDNVRPSLTLTSGTADPTNGTIAVTASSARPSRASSSATSASPTAPRQLRRGRRLHVHVRGHANRQRARLDQRRSQRGPGRGDQSEHRFQHPDPDLRQRPSELTLTSGTADPTNGTIAVTAQFSETVTGFVVGDISVTNGTAGIFVAVDGDTYTFVVTPTANGLVSISVAANVAQDAATNLNTASNTLTRTFDNVRPSLTLTSGTADPTNGTIAVTAQFSETVTGFVVGDISVTNGTAGSFVAVDGDTYTFVVTPTANGLVSISVAANVAQDAATNLNTASNTLTRTFDNVRPSLTLTSGTADPTNGTIAVTAQFSETVTGFVVGDISVTNGTAGSFIAVDGDTYTFVVTPTANGLVSISVAANVAQDAATNLNTASNTLTRTFDGTAPTVTLVTPADGAETNDSTPTFSGLGGLATGDLATVTVRIYAGANTSGSLELTLTASRDGTTGAYSVDPSALQALAEGQYTAQRLPERHRRQHRHELPRTRSSSTPPSPTRRSRAARPTRPTARARRSCSAPPTRSRAASARASTISSAGSTGPPLPSARARSP